MLTAAFQRSPHLSNEILFRGDLNDRVYVSNNVAYVIYRPLNNEVVRNTKWIKRISIDRKCIYKTNTYTQDRDKEKYFKILLS